MEYFSDRELGATPRTAEVVTPEVWAGIAAHISSLVANGAFGEHFPEICDDGVAIVGTDDVNMGRVVRAEIPGLAWPLTPETPVPEEFVSVQSPDTSETLVVLDLIEFCHAHVAKPIQGSYHSFFRHHHLSFDAEAGKARFREKMNRIFARNGLAYELQEDGHIIRLAPPILREALSAATFETGDDILDGMLEEARSKFLGSNLNIRREALERLWDAWERLKTIDDPANKKRSITKRLDSVASEPKMRELLETDADKLTAIGNNFRIRHSEVGKPEIEESSQIDYLFHRLLSMVLLLLHVDDR